MLRYPEAVVYATTTVFQSALEFDSTHYSSLRFYMIFLIMHF